MIKVENNVFILETEKTSYIFRVGEAGILEHLYYGRRMENFDIDLLLGRQRVKICDASAYSREHNLLFLDNLMTEFSTEGKGDYRAPAVRLSYDGGHSVLDFGYDSHRIEKFSPVLPGLPSAYGDDASTLVVTLKERLLPLSLELYYTIYSDTDVIVRHTRIYNNGKREVYINALSSLQLDLPSSEWSLITLDGAWARERMISDYPLRDGMHINESRNGASGSFHNPAIALRENGADNYRGEVYGFNLIYSGNHRESVERNAYGRVRVLSQINPETFSWRLEGGESFTTPEAVMVFSSSGLNGMSREMHKFVNGHIVRGKWKDRERPVVINNWEATGYDFDEKKLLDIAAEAGKAGIELFVLDDGWFGERNDDTTSLGDWYPDRKKLPLGIRHLSDEIHSMNMMFGIWVEPEGVSERSSLFKEHPGWRMAIPGREPSVGRNEYLLDYTNEEVTDYMIDVLSRVIEESNCDYVKWDMNRFFSDFYSNSSEKYYMLEFPHRYVMGYYKVMKALTEKFPDVLFEGCASGGNRFDLGVLCYSPQIWTSDDTDPFMRERIQDGTALFYPQSTISNHVSASPNGQTLRMTGIDDRFNIASFGVLGYELDLTKLEKDEKLAIRKEVEFYKKHRRLLQYGAFFRIKSPSPLMWMIADEREAVYLVSYGLVMPNMPNDNRLRIPFDKLDSSFSSPSSVSLERRRHLIDRKRLRAEDRNKYREGEFTEEFSIKVPLEQLFCSGILLSHRFYGSGDIRATRILLDFSTEMYVIEKENQE